MSAVIKRTVTLKRETPASDGPTVAVVFTDENYWASATDPDRIRGQGVRVGMRPDAYKDLGSPDQITVTIEPGDTLNEGG